MRDCKLVIVSRNDRVSIEGEYISLEELASLSGLLQVFVGTEGLKRGLDLDEVKGNMLDIHLAAMDMLDLVNKDDEVFGTAEERET